ncbi:MAG: alpha/beta hydrolase [Actinomycetes bacterium]
MPSASAKAIAIPIRLFGPKKTYASQRATLAEVAALAIRPESYAPPNRLDRKVNISVQTVSGWPVYTVSPRGSATARRALFSHGGAWYHQILSLHWNLIADLATSTDTIFTVPIYPLVPVGTAATVIPIISDLVSELVTQVGPESVTIMGDSAGGTITLAVAMHRRDHGLPAPTRTVLISPALDLTFTDPAIAETAPRDPLLAVPGPRAVAELWRGELAIDDPMVSPLHGDLAGLAPITMFSGTRDLLNADARALVRKAEAADFPVDYHEAPELFHDYPLILIPEGKAARSVIKELLR